MDSGESLEPQLEARDPDVRLMLQVRDDVQGAFEVLMQRYQHRLVGVLLHMVGSLEEAEDLRRTCSCGSTRAQGVSSEGEVFHMAVHDRA